MRCNIIYFLALLLLPTACDFGDTNLDPTLHLDADLKEILPAAITQTAHNMSALSNRVAGTIVQHFKGVDAHAESYSQYLIDERTLDEFWRTGLYAGAMKDCQIIMEKAVENNESEYSGIAKILMAINLGIATSFWGDIPYKDAFLGADDLNPAYDTQEEIYASIQELLAMAIKDLEDSNLEDAGLSGDLIFQGNLDKWIATAKALQARYYLHLSKQNENAAQMALNAIESGAFGTLKDQANFPFNDNVNEAHPLPLYCFERPDQLVLGDYLYQLLVEHDDPRLRRYALLVDGLPKIYVSDSLQLYWGQFETPLPFISLSELKFIKAEAQLRLNRVEEAEVTFKEAVRTHFKQMDIPVFEYESFVNSHIHFDNLPDFESQLQWIIQQKHLVLFGQNPIEAWVDFRRTTYPILSSPSSANPSFNPSLVIPQRCLYPISERTVNETNREQAIQRQGGHLMDVTLWAFK